MEIIGIEKVNYISKKTGKEVNGYNLYWRELLPIKDKNGNESEHSGYRCGHEYVKADIFDGKGISVGDSIKVLYNRYGSIENVELVI